MTTEEKFMQAAINAATDGMRNNLGGPFGCVIVKGGEIIASGCNRVLADNDPTAHAEVVAIRNACNALGKFQLSDCELYTSCEPCPMCLGAIYWARPAKVYFASTRHDAAEVGFDDSFIYDQLALPISDRKIPMQHLPVTEANEMFKQWAEANKPMY